MKISVLIPAFNADPFIESALASVRAQTFLDWEIVVVEDGSHDDTARIVERFSSTCPQPTRYENLGRHRGVGAARNRLLELARGQALAFLDADDTWEPSHLAAAAAELEAGGDLVVSGVRTFDLVKRRVLDEIPVPSSLLCDPVQTLFQDHAIITSSAVVLSREMVARTGRFDESLRIGEDRDYWLRAALAGARFRATTRVTCTCSRHLSNSTARTYLVAEQAVRFYEKHRALQALPPGLRRHQLVASLTHFGRMLRPHDPRRSADCFRRAWRCAPLNPRLPLYLALIRWRNVRSCPTA